MEKTLKFQHDKNSVPVLLCFLPDGHACDLPLSGRQTFGRTGRGANLCVPSPYISGRHGEFGIIQGRIMYRDTGSTNGTWINGQPCTSIHEILPGDIFTFFPKNNPGGAAVFRMIPVYLKHYPLTWRSVPLSPEIREIMVGRGEGTFRLEDPYVSTKHATFFNSARGWTVIDLGSTNGVYVNTRRIDGASKLIPGDIIQIGATWFYFTGKTLCFGTAGIPVTASGASLDGTVHGMAVEKPSADAKIQELSSAEDSCGEEIPANAPEYCKDGDLAFYVNEDTEVTFIYDAIKDTLNMYCFPSLSVLC